MLIISFSLTELVFLNVNYTIIKLFNMKLNKVSPGKIIPWIFLAVIFSVSLTTLSAQESYSYKTPADINKGIKSMVQGHGSNAMIHNLAKTPGGAELLMIEIGNEISSTKKMNPAVLVVGNMDGTRPITSEAALDLAEEIMKSKESYSGRTWYILPMGNPDAYQNYFSDLMFQDSRNQLPFNDDMDDQVDEDGFNDLDGNGIITKIRVIEPDGEWIPVSGNSKLMRKAEYKDGEKGIYKLYSEGTDDDGDGLYNEDGRGGVNVNANFPHLFEFFKPASGFYAGSTPESYAIMEFAFKHPEIAMTFSFGSTNFLLVPPKGGRSGSVDMEKISIPEEMAKMMQIDHTRTYSMKEIMEMVQPMLPPGMVIDEGMIASFLGLGAVVNPMQEDLVFYNKISEDYKKYLKDKGIEDDRYDPAPARDGSFELWSYYHLGVPVFSMDIWGLPKLKEEKKESSGVTIEALEKMSSEDFIALGEDKVNLFLKESGAPAEYKAEMVIGMVKGGQFTPEQMAGMMKQMPKPEGGDKKKGDPKEQALLAFSDTYLDGSGFVEWKEYDHPTLGKTEIGGFKPFIDINPPAEFKDSLLSIKVPYVLELVKNLPVLKIEKSEVTDKGSGIYKVDIWIENQGFIPFCTEMGKRNKIPVPAIITIEGDKIELLSGKARTPVNELGGNKSTKLSWLIKSEKNSELIVNLTSKTAGSDSKTLKLGE